MTDKKRVDVADVLRGFAIMGILFLHFTEHFNLHYYYPEVNRNLLLSNYILETVITGIFKGKAYAIFALLFGFSFWIQYERARQQNIDFRFRYMWRLFLLFIIGNLNAIFFTGDILVLYSIVGFVLIPVVRLPTKYVVLIASLLMLQPLELWKIIYNVIYDANLSGNYVSGYYFNEAFRVLSGDSFIETAKMNLYTGQLASFTWAWEKGRVFQTASLFMFGMLVGRTRLLSFSSKNSNLWLYACAISFTFFLFFSNTSDVLPEWTGNSGILNPLKIIWQTLTTSSLMITMVAAIIILYYETSVHRLLKRLAPYGRMSLTNYITQSIIGSFLFYGWGMAFYRTWGVTYCFFAGLVVFILQYFFSVWWLKHHKQGILERWWKVMTWVNPPKHLQKEKQPEA